MRCKNVPSLTDVIITRSSGNQLLVARGANVDSRDSCNQVSPLTSGTLELYPIFPQNGTPPISIAFNNLLRPRLLAENGGRLFVFDAGDTCACAEVDSIPRILGYQIGVSDPSFTIVDTSLALLLNPSLLEREGQKSPWVDVRGIAVADDRTVYVSGTFKLLARDEFGRFTLQFAERIWRYEETAPDVYTRDEDWEVLPGTGVGFIENHQGIAWGPADDPYLWVTDGGKQAVQKLEIETDPESHGVYAFDGTLSATGLPSRPTSTLTTRDSSTSSIAARPARSASRTSSSVPSSSSRSTFASTTASRRSWFLSAAPSSTRSCT